MDINPAEDCLRAWWMLRKGAKFTDETLPDIRQSKKLSVLYHLSLDELIDFDVDLKEIERVIENTSEDILVHVWKDKGIGES